MLRRTQTAGRSPVSRACGCRERECAETPPHAGRSILAHAKVARPPADFQRRGASNPEDSFQDEEAIRATMNWKANGEDQWRRGKYSLGWCFRGPTNS